MLSLCAQRKQLGFPRRLTLFCTNALISCLDRALLWHKHRNIFLQKLEWHWVILCRMSAWSPVRSLQSLAKFFLISGAATATAWYAHPQLLDIAAHVLNLDFKDNVTAFQTSFFSFLSLVFAIYSGNTMAFLYDRQKEVVKNLYAECMALEELLEEAVNTLGPDARDILTQVRVYIDQEMYQPENQSPPLGEGHALAAIRAKARNYRRAGTDVGEILQASQRLAHAQSARQATACRLLPPVHWALLYTIGALFVSTFILFETGGSFSNEGRHILFTVLCGLMSFVLVALRDLADPQEGVYNATALLAERLSYIVSMLNKYEKLPSRAPTAGALLGSSVPSNTMEEATKTPGNDLLSMLGGIKESTEEAEDKGQSKTGLMGALLGRPADSGEDEARNSSSSAGSANGTSKESSLSQIGASVMGVEAAERESRPAMPAGMGPSSNPGSSNGRISGNQEANSASNVSASQGAGQTSPVVRSMILEKPPSFKVRSQLPGQTMAGRTSTANARPRLRVSSLDETKPASESSKRPAGSIRPAANVR